jgi:hypothetical protein
VPHKGKTRPRADPVRARKVGLDRWDCGRCGQMIDLSRGHGWSYDADDRVWRPTAYHLRQRAIAERLLLDPTLSQPTRERLRARLRTNSFHQARERPIPPPGSETEAQDEIRGMGTDRFPKNAAACARCRVINLLNPATIQWQLIETDTA